MTKKKRYLDSKKYLKNNNFYEDKSAKSESYFYRGKDLPIVNKKLINCLILISDFTKKSIRINLHPNVKSRKHDMIILHRKNSKQQIHSHTKNGETVQMIRGKVKIEFFGKNLKTKKNVFLDDKNQIILSIPKKAFHRYKILSKFAIYHEFSIGPFLRFQTKIIV